MQTNRRTDLQRLLNDYYASRTASDKEWRRLDLTPTRSVDMGPASAKQSTAIPEQLEAQIKTETVKALDLLSAISAEDTTLSASLEVTLNVMAAEAVWLRRLARLDGVLTRGDDMSGSDAHDELPDDDDYYAHIEFRSARTAQDLADSKFLAQKGLTDVLAWLGEHPTRSISSVLDDGFQVAWDAMVTWLIGLSGSDGAAMVNQLSQHTLPFLGERLLAWVGAAFLEAVRTLLKLCQLGDSALGELMKKLKQNALDTTALSLTEAVLQLAPSRNLLLQKIESWTDPSDAAVRTDQLQTLYASLCAYEVQLSRIRAPMQWMAKVLKPILPIPFDVLSHGLAATVYLSIGVLHAEPTWFLAVSPTRCGVHSVIARNAPT